MIAAVVQQGRFLAEEQQSIDEIQVSLEPLLRLDKPPDQLIEQQLWLGWEMTVVELLWVVRCQSCRYLLGELIAVATVQASGSGGSTDGNVIEMALTAISSKGDDYVRAEAAKKFHYVLDQHFLVNVFERAAGIVEAPGMLDAQSLTGALEFLFTHTGQGPTGSRPSTTDLTRFTSSRRDDHHLCAMGDRASKGATCAKALIVGMGEDSKKTFRMVFCHVLLHIHIHS